MLSWRLFFLALDLAALAKLTKLRVVANFAFPLIVGHCANR
jgi:hypothetical protein